MGVRSKRLWSPTSMAAGTVLLYTAQSGETTLLKTVVIRNATAAPVTVYVGTGNASGVGTFLKATVPADDVHVWEGWIVVPEGVTVNGQSSAATASVRIAGYGAELEGVAD